MSFDRRRLAFLLALLLTLVPQAATRAPAGPPARTSRVEDAMDAFWNAEYDRSLSIVEKVLGDAASPQTERVEALKVASCVHMAREARVRARDAIVEMFDVDRQARFSPDYRYPPPVIGLYHEVRDSLHVGTLDIKTVAVGDFENNSVYVGKFKGYDFDLFKNVLVHLVTEDLSEATPFRIVDRQRTGQLLKEIQLSASEFSDPETAVRMGKFLGAHCFIFGQYSVLSKKEVRIDARVVQTATGEVILTKSVTGDFSGDPNKFLALEKKLVTDLADGLARFAGSQGADVGSVGADVAGYFEEKGAGMKGRKGYVEGNFLVAEAYQREAANDFTGAIERWREVLKTDPANDVAKVRIQVLAPLARG